MPDLPDDCVARIRAGDISAFEGLFRAMHQPLLAFAARYTTDTARAEELLQDLFFELWTARAEWVVRGSVSAYLYAAVRNRALNLRRRDVLEDEFHDAAGHDGASTLHTMPAAPDALLEQAELVMRVREAVARLPERCALVMQMRWHGGLSYAEIAGILGISAKGVENQLARGLKALRADLGGEAGEAGRRGAG